MPELISILCLCISSVLHVRLTRFNQHYHLRLSSSFSTAQNNSYSAFEGRQKTPFPRLIYYQRHVLFGNPSIQDRAFGSRLAVSQLGAQIIKKPYFAIEYRKQRSRDRRPRYSANGAPLERTVTSWCGKNIQQKSKIPSRRLQRRFIEDQDGKSRIHIDYLKS